MRAKRRSTQPSRKRPTAENLKRAVVDAVENAGHVGITAEELSERFAVGQPTVRVWLRYWIDVGEVLCAREYYERGPGKGPCLRMRYWYVHAAAPLRKAPR